jgi:Skp family chaperone for outer membrane proteins
VKKLLITLTLAAGLGLVFVWLPDACGQNDTPSPRAAKPSNASRIAFIDIGEVVRNYKKYDDAYQEARTARETAGAKYKQNVARLQQLGKELQDADLDHESREFAERQDKIVQLSASNDTYRTATENEFKKNEGRTLVAIHREIVAAVQQFAEQNGYTLVLRIDHEAGAARSYTTISQTMNQAILRHDSRHDITEPVTAWLNKQYVAAGGAAGASASAGRAAGGSEAGGTKAAPRRAAAPGAPRDASR